MKKYIIIALILALIISFAIGLYLYKLKNLNEQIAFEAEYRKLEANNVIENAQNLLQETSSSKNKTTPNTVVIEKKLYNTCEHLITTEKKIDNEQINKDEGEFQIEYIGWEIQKFTPTEVIVYKEINDFCDEHYLAKNENGVVVVYALDKYGKEKELICNTEIQTKYLTEADIENLEKGIKIYGKKELNKLLEDFE